MILVPGGGGFIGSNLVNALIKKNYKTAICDYKYSINKHYFENYKNIYALVEPKEIEEFINKNNIKFIIHLGAISSTTCYDGNKLWLNNIFFSSKIWKICCKKNIRLIYASSAATYGDGKKGFIDKEDLSYLNSLIPLNIYGWTKNEIDKRIIFSDKFLNIKPPQWVSLKFFNVYGPNEFHKNNMKSIVLKIYEQIMRNETSYLFKSHNPNYQDGEQKRDFIYVKDCINILLWFMDNHKKSGIFNVGTGQSRTFNDLIKSVYINMKKNINLKYIDMPNKIKNQYQYETKAEMNKLIDAGYNNKLFTLEEGVKDYLESYLKKQDNAIS